MIQGILMGAMNSVIGTSHLASTASQNEPHSVYLIEYGSFCDIPLIIYAASEGEVPLFRSSLNLLESLQSLL